MPVVTAAETLLRSEPNKKAPASPPIWLYQFFEWDASVLALVIMVIYTPILVVLHFIIGYPLAFPGWSFRNIILQRYNWLKSYLNAFVLPARPTPEDEWKLPSGIPQVREAMKAGKLKVGCSKVGPIDDKYRIGIGECPWIESVARPCFVITPEGSLGKSVEKAKEGEKVIYHIHGGGYIVGHPLGSAFASPSMDFALAAKQRVVSINYRKCLDAETAFPAPLLDALAGYQFITDTLGFKPSNITILGESAGAHLALALTRYLWELDLSLPGSMALSSPWSDFTASFPSYKTNWMTDFVHLRRLALAVTSACRFYTPKALKNVYFSPALAKGEDWKYLKDAGMKVYMMLGTSECMADEIRALGKAMKEGGVEVTIREDPGGVHTSSILAPAAKAVFQKDVLEMVG